MAVYRSQKAQGLAVERIVRHIVARMRRRDVATPRWLWQAQPNCYRCQGWYSANEWKIRRYTAPLAALALAVAQVLWRPSIVPCASDTAY